MISVWEEKKQIANMSLCSEAYLALIFKFVGFLMTETFSTEKQKTQQWCIFIACWSLGDSEAHVKEFFFGRSWSASVLQIGRAFLDKILATQGQFAASGGWGHWAPHSSAAIPRRACHFMFQTLGTQTLWNSKMCLYEAWQAVGSDACKSGCLDLGEWLGYKRSF